MLGGAHNNNWDLNPDNDLESRIDYPLDGITNFNNEKQALTTDVVQDHIHSPNYVSHIEHPNTDASAGNLANGKMENLLWKDFFSFEIPDKVTKKPNNVPDGNSPKMVANTHFHKKPAIDGKYDYEEEDDSWESYEDYNYPEETYTDYIDEYDVQVPKIGKRIDEESSDEYDDNMIVDAMLPHLKIGKPSNKKTSPFVDRLSLFNRDKKYSSDHDDDSTSHDIEHEETDKVPVGIKQEIDSMSSSEEQSHYLRRARKGSSSHSSSTESQSHSSESSLSLSDEISSSYEDYSTEHAKKYSKEIFYWPHQMNRGGSSGTSESISDEYSSESFSNENFSSSDEDSLSSSSEEHVPVVKDESRLDENRYVEESRAYHRKHFDDDDNINEVTTPLPKTNNNTTTTTASTISSYTKSAATKNSCVSNPCSKANTNTYPKTHTKT
uniref:Uncharacterized protein n=1 Tax=Magallana gigas TaxID=29159 RepID=K1PLK5_MAGGI